MEPIHLCLLLLSLSSLLASLFFYSYKHKTSNASSPPGTHGWPLIGETLAFFHNPVRFIKERTEKYQSHVFKTSLLTHPMIIFCGPAENKFLFSNENKLLVAWWPDSAKKMFPHSLLFFTGDKAHRTRRLLMKLMKPDDLRRYVGIMDAVARCNMREEWEGKSEVKAFSLAKAYNFCLSCRIMIGIEDPDKIMKLMMKCKVLLKGLMGIPLDFPGTAFYKAMRAAEAIRRELKSMIEERRAVSSEKKMQEMDLLSWLLVTEDDEGELMPKEEVLDNVLLYLIAAHEAGNATLAMVMKYLAQMPHVYDEVLKEQTDIAMSKEDDQLLDLEDIKKMKFTWNVVCEVMRLSPPAQGSFRVALTDFTYAGYHIPKGSKLVWTPHSTHRNPEWFPEPEKFDPSRFQGKGPAPYTFTPFGGGPRMCPGKEFAKLQILVFLHNVVKRFRWEVVFMNEKIVIEPTPTATQGLPLRLHPHQS
ncbi:hypothetical protein AAC387_Pa03g0745 [Persea americana]